MRRKSEVARVVRKHAAALRTPTTGQLKRLRAAAAARVDTCEISERRTILTATPVTRRTSGDVPAAGGPIRSAIIAQLKRRQMTGYALWKAAREHCATLPQSAVYEFLRCERQIGLEYIEALLAALDLRLRAPRSVATPINP